MSKKNVPWHTGDKNYLTGDNYGVGKRNAVAKQRSYLDDGAAKIKKAVKKAKKIVKNKKR